MGRITAEFGIIGTVGFLDVNVERDNLLFIDPSAIRKAAQLGDKYAAAANKTLTQYFNRILGLLLSASPADHRIGEGNLQHFNEIGETRLGMSRTGYQGHGAAKDLGTRIWEELRRNPLCRHAIATLKYIEDVPLFVEGIDKDVTSDITARIIVETLETFTTDMMRVHPEFLATRPSATFTTEFWDSASNSWASKTMTLPVADGKPLLLVPKSIVNYKIQMTYGQYYQVPLLSYIKDEELVEVRRGSKVLLRPRFTKKELRTKSGLAPGRQTNVEQTARIFEKDGTDLLGGYRHGQQTSFEPLSDSQLDHYLSRTP